MSAPPGQPGMPGYGPSGVPGYGPPMGPAGSPGYPAAGYGTPGYGPQPPSMPPMSSVPQLPPPPGAKRTGVPVFVWVIIGVLVASVVCCTALFVIGSLIEDDDPKARSSKAPTDSPSQSSSSSSQRPSPSPSRSSYRSGSTLDAASTDETPFDVSQFFHESSFTGSNGETFTLEAQGTYSACDKAGGTKTKSLMQANGCGTMAVGVYLNSAQDLMVGVMVIPLPAASNATAVFNAVDASGEMRADLSIWCPKAPTAGSKVCENRMSPSLYRYFTYRAFHRYALIASNVYTDGRTSGNDSVVHKSGVACLTHVSESIQRVY